MNRGDFFGNQSVSANWPTPTQEQASKMLNVSERTIRRIKQLEREAPTRINKIF